MLYVNSNFTGQDWWSVLCRRYLMSIKYGVGDLRVLWRQKMAIQPEMVEEEFHPLLPHLGGGRTPCSIGLYAGDIVGAVDYIMRPESAAPKNIALVTCPADRIQDNLVDPMRTFEAVVVPSDGARRALVRSGLDEDRVYVVPIPCDAGWWEGAEPEMEPTSLFVFYAIGEWGGLDNVQSVVAAYLRELKPEDNALLYVCCPDHPVRKPEDLAELVGVDSPDKLPMVAIDDGSSCLEGTTVYWRKKHLSGDCYVSASRRLDLDPWVLDAAVAGRSVVVPKGLAPWAFVSGDLDAFIYVNGLDEADDLAGERGIGFGQQCGVPDEASLQVCLRQVIRRRIEPRAGAIVEDHSINATGSLFVRIVKDVLAMDGEEPTPTVEPSADIVDEDSERGQASLAVVIPFRNRGLEEVTSCVSAITDQLREGDEIIIADQESDALLRRDVMNYVMAMGYSVIGCKFEDVWNLSRARNAGATMAEEFGCELILFLDVDVRLADGYVEMARMMIEAGDVGAACPLVFEDGRDPREGSGIAMIRTSDMDRNNGFDELYKGWGSEDVDFFWRLKRDFGVGLHCCDGSMGATHHDHEEPASKEDWGPDNLARVEKVMQGELRAVNPEGWRGGLPMVIKGDEL